jgi:AraC-like DNA-binding protein
MTAIPLVRASVLWPYLDALGTLGAPCANLLARVHLPPAEALQPDALISYQQVLDFAAVSQHETGVPQFSALLAQHAGLAHLGSWGRILGHAKTLGELFRITIETSWMHTTGARWWLEERGPDVLLCHQFDRRLDLGRGDALVPLLGYILSGLRRVLGAGFTPREIALAAPIPLELEWLGVDASVRVSAVTSLLIPRRLLSTPTPAITAMLANRADDAAAALAKSAPENDLVGSLRQALLPLACAGRIEIGMLAEITRLPIRTLQRRLAEAGVHYRALVEEVRFARALQRMADPSVKLIDVAFALGYSDPAHFTRAFRRWTGVSPRAFRRIHEADGRAAFPRAASPSN